MAFLFLAKKIFEKNKKIFKKRVDKIYDVVYNVIES